MASELEVQGVAKALCKLAKKGELKQIAEAARVARFICKKCGRTAEDRKSLCSPVPVEEL